MDLIKELKESQSLGSLKNLIQDPLGDLPILSAKIKLLWQCNLACDFCNLPKPGSPLQSNLVIDILGQLKQKGLKKVHFSGGEVFLHPEIWTILAASKELGLQVNLTTNGTQLNKESIKKLFALKIDAVSLSIDSGESSLHDKIRGQKGAFKQTLKTVKLLTINKKKRPKVRINTVITRLNFHTLNDLHQILLDISPEIYWKLLPVDCFAHKKHRLDQESISIIREKMGSWTLLECPPFPFAKCKTKELSKGRYSCGYYNDHICYMPWLHLFIDPLGFVYPCCMSRGEISALGNVHESNIEEILHSQNTRHLRLNMAAKKKLNVCAHCDDFLSENILIEKNIVS